MKRSIKHTLGAAAALLCVVSSLPAHAALNGDQFKDKCDKTPSCHYRTSESGAVTGGFVDKNGHHHVVDCPAGGQCSLYRKAGTPIRANVEATMSKAMSAPKAVSLPGNPSKVLGDAGMRAGAGIESRGLAASGSALSGGAMKQGSSGSNKLR